MESLQKTMELLTRAIALLATLCFLFSIMFDWGYFSALGLRFSVVPTSLSDHMRTSLIWVPVAVAILLFTSVWVIYREKTERQTAVDAAKAEDREAGLKRGAKPKAPWVLIGIAAPLALIWLLLGDHRRDLLTMSLLLAWPVAVIYATHGLATQGLANVLFVMRARLVLILIPSLAFGVYSMGQNTARFGVFGGLKPATIVLKNQTGQSTHHLTILRTFEKVVLAKDASGMITWVRTEDIARVEGLSQPPFFLGLLCTSFNIRCKAPTPF